MPNTALPVFSRYRDIVRTVSNNPVTIVTTETGTGKSTQIPQYLLAEGYNLVVTQPRRLAVRTVAARVAEEVNTPLGELIGFRTAYERQCSKATRCLFVTDGLALVRELMGAGHHNVLVLDEVHEWNLNMEVLVAWAKRQIEKKPNFKLVLMSATVEAERLSNYFGGAPVITVPGRAFPVEEQAPVGATLEDDVVNLLRQGRNVLVFQPGKREIGETVNYLKSLTDLNAEILPLHGELAPEEQAMCFRSYGRPKCVVSTNVAQTSVTIPDIDAVVDSGEERRVELVDGIEGLYLKSISLADRAQRKGRAGRTKPGIYIDWCPSADRLEFPKAEILRVRLDQTVLRLAEVGIDMEKLRLFHQPELAKIHDAKRALIALGCMDKDGRVTQIGHHVAMLPVSVKYARMIIEADKLGVVDDVITVAAILEQKGITAQVCPTHQAKGHKSCSCWRRLVPNEDTSDVIAQLLAYRACEGMTKAEMREGGIFVKAYYQAREKRRHLAAALKGKVREFKSSGNQGDILRAVCAGMVDHLYEYDAGRLKNGDGQYRELAYESVVKLRASQQGDYDQLWLVGEPFDLGINTSRGPKTVNLVRMATKVEPNWLAAVAPQLVETIAGLNPRYDENQDDVVSTTETWFNGQLIESQEVLDPSHADAAKLRCEGRIEQQWQDWSSRPEIALPDPSDDTVAIPDIVACAYGVDDETGEPLMAYGTVALFGYRYYHSDPWFRVLWTRDASEAKARHEEAASRLNTIQAEARAAAERRRKAEEAERLRRVAEPLRQQIVKLWQTHSNDPHLPWELLDRLYYGDRLPYTSEPETMRQWMDHAQALIAEVSAELAASQVRRAEATRRMTELAKTAQTLRNDANSLLIKYEKSLSDELYDELDELDVDDDQLPDTEAELRAWVTRAEALVTKAKALVAGPRNSISQDALSALAERYGKRS